MRSRNWAGVSSIAVVSVLADAGVALAQGSAKVPYIPETSVAVGSLFMILVGVAIFALLGAFIVKLATSWVCGDPASYGQGYRTFFLANAISSICAISVPMLIESIIRAKMHPVVIAIGGAIGLATWPLVYGKLISIEAAEPIGVKKGLFVSLIMAAVNGIVFLVFGGPAMFAK